MSNVYEDGLIVPRIPRNKRIYGGNYTGANTIISRSAAANLDWVEVTEPRVYINRLLKFDKEIITFTATATPGIADYVSDQINGKNYTEIFGQYPQLRLMTIDGDGNYYERQEKPKFTMVTGLITAIFYDLSSLETGYIILQ